MNTDTMMSFEQYIRESTLKREEIDVFLSAKEPSWASFDSDVGYILGNYLPPDGIDNSLTISTCAANGSRRSVVYADRPCRINTYGNSFTQCHQVSDHETWQEYLAAHLGEPIRNFGVGGFGVYQAYRRMIRIERTADGADYIILYIWGDDHIRSLLRCRYVLTRKWHQQYSHLCGRMFHGNFWANIEMDIDTGSFVERENLLAAPASLYRMTDPDFMVDALRDDLMLQMSLFGQGEVEDIDIHKLNRLADCLGCSRLSGDSIDQLKNQVFDLRTHYGFAATRYIIEHAEEFTIQKGKKLLIVLFCPTATRELIRSGLRYDRPIVDYLANRGVRYFDMNLVHAQDYKNYNLSLEKYLQQYLIGHYNPKGNHFFAYAIKDVIVDWLEPKPITYRDEAHAHIDFHDGYLP